MDRLETPLEALRDVSTSIEQLCTIALRDDISEALREALRRVGILLGQLCTMIFRGEIRDRSRTIAQSEESEDPAEDSRSRSFYREVYVVLGELYLAFDEESNRRPTSPATSSVHVYRSGDNAASSSSGIGDTEGVTLPSLQNHVGSYGSSGILRAQCRICHEEEDVHRLENPGCACRGSMMYAHRHCIQRWCDQKGDTICEICRQPYRNGYTVAGRAARRAGGRPWHNQGAVNGSRAADRAGGRPQLNQGPAQGAVHGYRAAGGAGGRPWLNHLDAVDGYGAAGRARNRAGGRPWHNQGVARGVVNGAAGVLPNAVPPGVPRAFRSLNNQDAVDGLGAAGRARDRAGGRPQLNQGAVNGAAGVLPNAVPRAARRAAWRAQLLARLNQDSDSEDSDSGLLPGLLPNAIVNIPGWNNANALRNLPPRLPPPRFDN